MLTCMKKLPEFTVMIISGTLPTGRQSIGVLTPIQKPQRASRTALEGLGLTQAISYSLTTAEKAKMFFDA